MSSAKKFFNSIISKLSGSKKQPQPQPQQPQPTHTPRRSTSVPRDMSRQMQELLALQKQHKQRSKEKKPNRVSISKIKALEQAVCKQTLQPQQKEQRISMVRQHSFSFKDRLSIILLENVVVHPSHSHSHSHSQSQSHSPPRRPNSILWKTLLEVCPFCNKKVGKNGKLLRCMHKAHKECLKKEKTGYCSLCKNGLAR